MNLAAPSRGFPVPSFIVQADAFNRSRLRTVLGVILTSSARLVDMPGNVLLPAKSTGLPKDSIANVTQIVTVDEDYLSRRVGQISSRLMTRVDSGLRRVLAL